MKIFSSQTKMISHRQSKSRSKLYVVLGLVFFALIILVSPLRTYISFVFSEVYRPLLGSSVWVGDQAHALGDFFTPDRTLIEERDKLREQLRDRDADILALSLQIKDYDKIRGLLEEVRSERVVAGILARPNQTPYDTLLIDRGSSDGVVVGALVYARGDVAIGTVIRADRMSSLVSLFSSPGTKLTAYVHGPDILVRGEGIGGGIIRVAIPHGLPFEAGDTVVLPTISSGVIGEISRVEKNVAEPDAYGFVSNPIAISSLRYVSVARTVHVVPSVEEIREAMERASTTVTALFVLPEGIHATVSTSSESEN